MYGGQEYNTNDAPVGQYIKPGVQELVITGFDVKSASTGSQQVIFNVEGPCSKPGFKPHDEAKLGGRIGKIQFTSYMKLGSQAEQDFQKDIQILADKLGVKEAVVKVTANSLKEYVEAVFNIIKHKAAIWAVTGEEYPREGKSPGVRLGRRRFGFVASMAEGINHLKPFDKTNPYDYKKLVEASAEPVSAVGLSADSSQDLPF